MANKDGIQKGAQGHAQGEHGEKTRQRLMQQLHSHSNGNGEAVAPQNGDAHPEKHRLTHDREQHDSAEKRSEKTRLSRDVERHRI